MGETMAEPDWSDLEKIKTLTWALTASDEAVGPACMLVPVPPTIDMSDKFREAYAQGWRHALWAVRRLNRGQVSAG